MALAAHAPSDADSPSIELADVLPDAAQEGFAFRRRGGPHWLEIGGRPATDLHVCVDLAFCGRVEVEIRLASKMEVWAIGLTTRDIDEPVDRTQLLDQIGVRQLSIAANMSVRRKRRPGSWASMPIVFLTTCHEQSFSDRLNVVFASPRTTRPSWIRSMSVLARQTTGHLLAGRWDSLPAAERAAEALLQGRLAKV